MSTLLHALIVRENESICIKAREDKVEVSIFVFNKGGVLHIQTPCNKLSKTHRVTLVGLKVKKGTPKWQGAGLNEK